MSRGFSTALSGRTRGSFTLFWAVLFVLSLALQYGSFAAPRVVLGAAGDPVVTLEDGVNGCNGVRPTPGSENTNKRLVGGSLQPGGTATFEISFPVDPADVSGRETFVVTDCVFINDTAVLKYSVSFVPNTENFILTITLDIPVGTPLGSQYCNYAKTTAAPSSSQASNRKAGPACFTVGGDIRVLKTNEAGAPLAGAVFSVACTLPTTTAFLPPVNINGTSYPSVSGAVVSTTTTTGANGLVAIVAPVGTSCVITETTPPDGYRLAPDPSVTLVVASGTVQQHTFVNTMPSPALSLVKTASPSTYSAVGNVIDYSYLVTNTGNVTLAGPVTVTDDKATVTCPAGGLAPAASMTCTASHTITQADLEAGSVKNIAQAHANGTNSNFDDETVTAVKTPHLSITKLATEQSYSAVGQIIHYTIVATNDGNVTLTNVVVTDPKVSGLDCTPALPVASLVPGGTITCTATHTVTQADLDAGHFANTACVDDGEGGAVQACADKDVPGDKTPHLSITKVATEQSYSAVGQIIHYTIVATNDGNASIASATVTDPKVSNLTCTPANGSPLAPGASLNCTATHTVTQADLEAGHFANTACVDDGEGGALQACADEDVPGVGLPAIGLTKVANPTGLPFGGGSVTYTYVVTNPGNISLRYINLADVISGTSTTACTPTGPVETSGNADPNLDPGESWTYSCTKNITVTTSNTATATGRYGEAGSVSATASATVTVGTPPPPQLGSLTITKVVSPAADFAGGTFKFDVSCATQQTITLAAGEGTKSVTINNLPLGVSCTVTEVTPLTAGPGWQWVGQPAYAPGQTVNVPATVTVTNSWGQVAAATATPRVTPPPTATVGESTANPGSNLGPALAALSLFGLVLGVLAPKPARARRRSL